MGVSMYISNDHLGAFFSDFGPVEEVSSIKSKAGFATSDYKVMLTLTRPKFNEVPNVITCCGRNIHVVVESRRPNCLSCGDPGHLAKLYPCKNPAPEPQISKQQPRAEEPRKVSCSFGE